MQFTLESNLFIDKVKGEGKVTFLLSLNCVQFPLISSKIPGGNFDFWDCPCKDGDVHKRSNTSFCKRKKNYHIQLPLVYIKM